LASTRGWTLALGLQLRADIGGRGDPNQDIATFEVRSGASVQQAERSARWFAGLSVLDRPRQTADVSPIVEVPEQWLVGNRWGRYVRLRGGWKGLALSRAPHVFLWNTFAAYSDKEFIFRHPDVGVSAPAHDADWLRAVSVIWSSSITPYMLLLGLSASWGVSRSVIDLGDAEAMSMPALTDELVYQLASIHRELASTLPNMDVDRSRRKLDEGVASVLGIPNQVMTLAQDFVRFRLPLVKGKIPRALVNAPDMTQLKRYAEMLKTELDGFLEGRSRRHDVAVLRTRSGIIASVELKDAGATSARVIDGDDVENVLVEQILKLAQRECGQWAYVRRSVRVFGGKQVHICKPARRLEWTETQALMDAADLVSEIVHARRMQA
jgi:hypothetical protein